MTAATAELADALLEDSDAEVQSSHNGSKELEKDWSLIELQELGSDTILRKPQAEGSAPDGYLRERKVALSNPQAIRAKQPQTTYSSGQKLVNISVRRSTAFLSS